LCYAGQQAGDEPLHPVRVLVLIDQHVAAGVGDLGAGLRVVAQQLRQQHEQIVVVHQVLGALPLRVALTDAEDGLGLLLVLRVLGDEDALDVAVGVDGLAEHVHDRAAAREAALGRREAELGPDHADERLGVAAVEQGERGGVAQPAGVPA
jgi:hypothetical protein